MSSAKLRSTLNVIFGADREHADKLIDEVVSEHELVHATLSIVSESIRRCDGMLRGKMQWAGRSNADMSDLHNSVKGILERYENLENEIAKLRGDLVERHDEARKVNDSAPVKPWANEGARIISLEQRNADLQKMVKDLTTRLSNANALGHDHVRALRSAAIEIENGKRQLHEVAHKAQTLGQQSTERGKTIDHLQRELNRKQRTNNTLRVELRKARDSVSNGAFEKLRAELRGAYGSMALMHQAATGRSGDITVERVHGVSCSRCGSGDINSDSLTGHRKCGECGLAWKQVGYTKPERSGFVASDLAPKKEPEAKCKACDIGMTGRIVERGLHTCEASAAPARWTWAVDRDGNVNLFRNGQVVSSNDGAIAARIVDILNRHGLVCWP